MDDKQAVQETEVLPGGWPEHCLAFICGKFSPAGGFGPEPEVGGRQRGKVSVAQGRPDPKSPAAGSVCKEGFL